MDFHWIFAVYNKFFPLWIQWLPSPSTLYPLSHQFISQLFVQVALCWPLGAFTQYKTSPCSKTWAKPTCRFLGVLHIISSLVFSFCYTNFKLSCRPKLICASSEEKLCFLLGSTYLHHSQENASGQKAGWTWSTLCVFFSSQNRCPVLPVHQFIIHLSQFYNCLCQNSPKWMS